jgi:hypothetical protein
MNLSAFSNGSATVQVQVLDSGLDLSAVFHPSGHGLRYC